LNAGTVLPTVRFIKVRWGGVLGEQKNRIYLPPHLFKSLGLTSCATVTFKAGSLCRVVTVGLVHCSSGVSEPIFFFSPDLAGECQLPVGTAITLKFDQTANVLFAGPLIGLFSVRNILPDTEFGSQEAILRALANSSATLDGLVYVFCPEDIDWDRCAVTGYIPLFEQGQEASGWLPLRLPLPDVIYDRVPSRSVESRPEVLEAKSGLMMRPGLFYFNPMFLNKWETHLALQNIPEVSEYLPPTNLVETPEDIKHFLSLYNPVFLKPSSGSLGRRIIKVEATDKGRFRYMYRSREKQTIEGTAADFTSLMNFLRPVMGKRNYIVQKDLQLALFEKCPFDIRALAQKDNRGNWRRTKIYVRKAAPGSFLSNLSDGAHPWAITTVLKEVFNCDFLAGEGLGEEIRNAVKTIPPALEQGTGLIWGELGIDLGIDRNGKIWLIEINSKPFRALVSDRCSLKVIERSLMRPLEFAKFLAGFYRHSIGGNPYGGRAYSGNSEHSPRE